MSKRRTPIPTADDPSSNKRPREDPSSPPPLGDDMLFEVLGRADARSLARAACVCRHWRRLTLDERLWEIVCTRHWSRIGSSPEQLRATVLAIGGFRKLHSLYILPLVQKNQCRPSSSSPTSSSLSAILPSGSGAGAGAGAGVGGDGVERRAPAKPLPKKWGKDEIMLSMSLLSTRHFNENWGHRRRGGANSDGGGGGGAGGVEG